jgi:membrane-associated phospholipid phosphatase
VSATSGEDPATLRSPTVGLFAVGSFDVPSAADADISASTANRTLRSSQGTLSLQTRGLARFTQRLGDPRIVGPALLASYVTGRITGLPNFSAASARIAGATFSAAVLCEGIKLAVGRARPDAAPGASGEPGSLGWHDENFPSGPTTIAFATASAIDAESSARWVRWVVYPVAAAAGLAQVHENGCGLSDVAAGAALGYWTGRRVDQIERGQMRIFDRARFLVRGSPRNFRVGFKARF